MDSKLLEELTDDNIDEQLITEEIEKLSEEYDLRAIKSVYLCTVLVGCSHLACIYIPENYYQCLNKLREGCSTPAVEEVPPLWVSKMYLYCWFTQNS